MIGSDPSAGERKYYDPSEVEAYIKDATTTITTLQAQLEEVSRRAAEAEQALGEYQPETATLGRALLLAGEVADKTIAEADAKAEEILRAAGDRANVIIEAARAEAERVVGAAKGTAANAFQAGEARLIAAVNAFLEGAQVLREELASISDDATNWRNSVAPSARYSQPQTPPFAPPPPRAATPPASSAQPAGPSTVYGQGSGATTSSKNGAEPAEAGDSVEPGMRISPFTPPMPIFGPNNDHPDGTAGQPRASA